MGEKIERDDSSFADVETSSTNDTIEVANTKNSRIEVVRQGMCRGELQQRATSCHHPPTVTCQDRPRPRLY